MLQSPRYGERMARLWLDLVRYAESDGYKADGDRPEAWRYRDYVVRSFNQDKPYDQFLTEQLAGDEIDPDDPELRTATQYLRLWPYEYNQRDVWNQRQIILNDITDVTADVVLGLGFACPAATTTSSTPSFSAIITAFRPSSPLFFRATIFPWRPPNTSATAS